MVTVKLAEVPVPDEWVEGKPDLGGRANFALYRAVGTQSSAVVCFELDPGKALGRHVDSAEEILLVLDGAIEVSVNGEQRRMAAGELAVVPGGTPHHVRHVGASVARIVGFFSAADVRSEFDEIYQPFGLRVYETRSM